MDSAINRPLRTVEQIRRRNVGRGDGFRYLLRFLKRVDESLGNPLPRGYGRVPSQNRVCKRNTSGAAVVQSMVEVEGRKSLGRPNPLER